MNFSAEDLEFLHAVGIDPGSPDAEKFLALARQISKHRAPGQQVKLDPQAAKSQLIKLAMRMLLDGGQSDGPDEEL